LPQLLEFSGLLLLGQRGYLLRRLGEVGVLCLGGVVCGQVVVLEPLAAVVADKGLGVLAVYLGDGGLSFIVVFFCWLAGLGLEFLERLVLVLL
jgi:hypothetical protein